MPTTHLKIEPEVTGMSDEALLELYNDTLRAQAEPAAEYKHVAVEVPLGQLLRLWLAMVPWGGGVALSGRG